MQNLVTVIIFKRKHMIQGAHTHTYTHRYILNYHCIVFLSDPIILEPHSNYDAFKDSNEV